MAVPLNSQVNVHVVVMRLLKLKRLVANVTLELHSRVELLHVIHHVGLLVHSATGLTGNLLLVRVHPPLVAPEIEIPIPAQLTLLRGPLLLVRLLVGVQLVLGAVPLPAHLTEVCLLFRVRCHEVNVEIGVGREGLGTVRALELPVLHGHVVLRVVLQVVRLRESLATDVATEAPLIRGCMNDVLVSPQIVQAGPQLTTDVALERLLVLVVAHVVPGHPSVVLAVTAVDVAQWQFVGVLYVKLQFAEGLLLLFAHVLVLELPSVPLSFAPLTWVS